MPHLVKENMNVNQMHWQGFKKKTQLCNYFKLVKHFPPNL